MGPQMLGSAAAEPGKTPDEGGKRGLFPTANTGTPHQLSRKQHTQDTHAHTHAHKDKGYLNREITEASGKKSLYRIVDSFLIKKPSLQLPRHKSLSELADRFSDHCRLKISNIRSNLDAASSE